MWVSIISKALWSVQSMGAVLDAGTGHAHLLLDDLSPRFEDSHFSDVF